LTHYLNVDEIGNNTFQETAQKGFPINTIANQDTGRNVITPKQIYVKFYYDECVEAKKKN